MLGNIVPHPSHLTRPLIRVHLTKVQRHHWNRNLPQDEQTDTVRTVTSYLDPVWNAFSQIYTLLDPRFKNYNMCPTRKYICQYWSGRLSGHTHVNQTYPDVVRMWRQFHGCPTSGGGIDSNQYQISDLWRQRSLHRWWWYIQETQVTYGGRSLVRGRVWRRWLSDGLTQWF